MAISIYRCRLTSIGIPMLKIRPFHDHFIFNMGIAIPGKTVFILRRACRTLLVKIAVSCIMVWNKTNMGRSWTTMQCSYGVVASILIPASRASAPYVIYSYLGCDKTAVKPMCKTRRNRLKLITGKLDKYILSYFVTDNKMLMHFYWFYHHDAFNRSRLHNGINMKQYKLWDV